MMSGQGAISTPNLLATLSLPPPRPILMSKKSTGGLIKRFFTRQSNTNIPDYSNFEPPKRIHYLPDPSVRPMGRRLEARDETFHSSKPLVQSKNTPSQERQQVELTTEAAHELGMKEKEEPEDPPLLQRDSPLGDDFSDHLPRYPRAPRRLKERVRIPKIPVRAQPNQDTSNPDVPVPGAEQTPPNSDDSGDDSWVKSSAGYGKNQKGLSIDTLGNQSYESDLMTPESPIFEDIPPRPFSSSDLTSVSQFQHRSTPESWFEDDDHLPEDNLPIFKTKDVLDHTAAQAIEKFRKCNSETPSPQRPDDGLPLADSPVMGKFDFYYQQFKATSKPESHRDGPDLQLSGIAKGHNMNVSSRLPQDTTEFNGQQNSTSQVPLEPELDEDLSASMQEEHSVLSLSTAMTSSDDPDFSGSSCEAKFAAEMMGRQYNFDLVYVAEFLPTRAPTESPEVKILASYGQVPNLDVHQHLELIREDVVRTWENTNPVPGQPYQGFMMRLKTYGYANGIVLGAFRNAPKFGGRLPKLNTNRDGEDMVRFDKGARAMKEILFKGYASPDPDPLVMSSPAAYPAYEAVEVATPGSENMF